MAGGAKNIASFTRFTSHSGESTGCSCAKKALETARFPPEIPSQWMMELPAKPTANSGNTIIDKYQHGWAAQQFSGARGCGGETHQEVPMLKGLSGLLAVLFVTGSSLAYAQNAARRIPSQAEINTRMDMRLAIAKDALALTPDQQKYWPAIQDAVHSTVQARYARLSAVEQRLNQGNIDSVELLRGRANALAQRAAELKKLADAWEPFYKSLTPDQKSRVRFLAERALPALRVAVDTGRLRGFNEGASRNTARQTGGGTVGIAPQ
jgi:LTXXQ motif family protein